MWRRWCATAPTIFGDWPEAGRYFDVNSALIPFGKVRFVHMILHDVTQRREMLDELLRTERLAAAGTFAAGVAHEVNNPLGSFCTLVQSLLPEESGPCAAHLAAYDPRADHVHLDHVKDLVNFARPSLLQRSRFDLNDQVRETLRLVATTAASRASRSSRNWPPTSSSHSPTATRFSRC